MLQSSPEEQKHNFNAEKDSDDLAFVAELAQRTAGLCLPPSKAPMVRARIQRRLRPLKMETISEYCNHLRSTNDHGEIEALISVLTTNVTNFYREKHHFEYMRQQILPDLVGHARSGGRVRIWSAGCSTGEEPSSIALDILKECPEANGLDIKILATDIDKEVLLKAKAAIYDNAILGPVVDRHGGQVLEVISESADRKRIARDARALISYKWLNLVESWPMSGPFQVIFCRNVLIYFDASTQNKLWPRFRSLLQSGGHLFLGHSERLENPEQYGAETVGTTAYRFN